MASSSAYVEEHIQIESRNDTQRSIIALDSRPTSHISTSDHESIEEYVTVSSSVSSTLLEPHSPNAANEQDLHNIWSWNSKNLESVDLCVHDIFAERVRQCPEAPAVCAWDGEMTYSLLDELSTRLAHQLLEIDIRGTFVPLCFEKSKWVPVAALAVMKAGGASVALDPMVPQERLKSIVAQISPKAILTSFSSQELANSITTAPVISLSGSEPDAFSLQDSSKTLALVDPNSPLYIVFTSGSTGIPKGVIITHANFASAVKYQQRELGFRRTSRVFDLVSYAFDVTWSNILHTLTIGGCLCIPREDDVRALNVTESITLQRVNFLHITPTVARLLEPRDMPTLEKILFIGEPLKRADAARWSPQCEIYNTYGPAECTVTSTMAMIHPSEKEPSIGTAIGCVTWVVDPETGLSLMPLGSVGELWLEGPIVGGGYLNNPKKTADAFVNDPQWLLDGSYSVPGRHGRLYRTGDLVCYDTNGSLSYVGRKDTQVKIRGQRVELGDVEHHVRELLPAAVMDVVAEVIPADTGREQTLTVFLALPQSSGEDDSHARVANLTTDLGKSLARQLPTYMIPGAYIPLSSIPRTASGKTDRKALREKGAQVLTLDALDPDPSCSSDKAQPTTATEKEMQLLWSSVLEIAPRRISRFDSFLRLGGDSIAAIRLVAATRKKGLSLSVADIFRFPTLLELSELVQQDMGSQGEKLSKPFSLLKPGLKQEDARIQAAKLCSVEVGTIEDIFPCTGLQEGLLAMTAHRAGEYVSEILVELHPNVDLNRFRNAWARVGLSASILRTRIIDLPEQGLVQVVLSTSISWEYDDSMEDFRRKFKDDECSDMMGKPLARFGTINDIKSGKKYFAWKQHHAMYDGWSLQIVQEAVEQAYQGSAFESLTPLSSFVGYLQTTEKDAAFWEQYFANLRATQFPALPSTTYRPRADTVSDHRIEEFEWPLGSVTPSTVIRSAWALLAASQSGSMDTVFGVVVSGRQVPVAGIERMAGPTIATVPVRIEIDESLTIDDFLQQTQLIAVQMIPFEQTGLQRIQRVSGEAERACRFQTLLVVQPTNPTDRPSSLFKADLSDADAALDKERPDISGTHALTLEFRVERNALQMQISFDSSVLNEQRVTRMFQQLDHILRQICTLDPISTKVGDISLTSQEDLRTIWSWNADVPETAHACIHDLISERAREQPDAPAICAWDGELTYSCLDELSTQLAYALFEAGISGPGLTVPLLFDKSMWTPVSALAVMKTGGASVLLDATQPEKRLKSILEQIGCQYIMNGSSTTALASKISGSTAYVVSDATLLKRNIKTSGESSNLILPSAKPSDPLYTVFTSGSTGQPKEVVISHSNFASEVKHVRDLLRFKSVSRVADFTSYAFDVSWANLINTFTAGGCLCIPSEHERKNDLLGFLSRARVNYLDLTPSVAATLDWDRVPELDTIVVGGELVELDRLPYYDLAEAIIVTYGPAECTVTASAINIKAQKACSGTIGSACGLTTWIVDPEKNELLPVGCTGELLLEGPLVGQGYRGDAEKTAAAFMEDPEWLLRGSPASPGRRGRLYRTGDLVRYESDGTITFVARKDTQVKLRGQRVELSEVEYHIRQTLPADKVLQVIAEVIYVGESKRQLLVAFLSINGPSDPKALQEMATSLVAGLDEKLALRLPSYMIPSTFFPLDSFPLAATGKTDRRALREIAASMGPKALTASRNSRSDKCSFVLQPTTDAEVKLRSLWASVLEIESDKISTDDNFIGLGGDSIAAMRLVSAARRQGILISVADVLKNPQLSQLALLAVRHNATTDDTAETVPPFSLLNEATSKFEARQQAAVSCFVDESEVEDVFPCTALQEGLLAMTAQRSGDYISRIVTDLLPEVDIERFQKAWEDVIAIAPILRTRIIELPGHGLVQVVLVNRPPNWTKASSVEEYQRREKEQEHNQQTMCTGMPLTQSGLIEVSGRRLFAWTQHHALFDGWSLPLIEHAVEQVYHGAKPAPLAHLQPFVKYLRNQTGKVADAFWAQQFLDLEAPQFPPLSVPSYRPRADRKINHVIDNIDWPVANAAYTSSVVIRTAWAILVSWQSGSTDTVFGAVVSGREAPVKDIEHIVGPTIATVPVRVKFADDVRIGELLEQVKHQAIAMIPFEQTGLQNIRRVNKETDRGCQFQTLLVVQPAGDKKRAQSSIFQGDMAGNDKADLDENIDTFSSYAVGLTCQLDGPSVRMQISFDSEVVSHQMAEKTASQFEHILHQLCLSTQRPETRLCDLDMVSDRDLRTIWGWNARVPEAMHSCVHHIFAETVRNQPNATAVCAWDGEMTYSELDKRSTKLALHLIAHGVEPGVLVPLCFDKSCWVPLVVMAVMKAGATSVALDTTQPKERLRSIVEQLSPRIILTSKTRQSLAAEICDVSAIVIDHSTVEDLHNPGFKLPSVDPTSPLYVVFTSGSTGQPKGATVTHENFCSAIRHQQNMLRFHKSSRVFDFTSYAFDVFWSNILHTLTSGGCFAIPSQDDRLSDVIGAINRLHVNYAHFTPTLARILQPADMPGLKTVIFSGEALKRSDASRWASSKVQVLNTYGPAECTVTSTMAEIRPDDIDEPPIGHALGTVSWIVRQDGQGLCAIGTIGELWLEGPLVGNGYLNDPKKTASAFVEDPAWLLKGSRNIPGRRGRLYRTGDLVKYNDRDHSIQYIGRKDTQVKIRGQRIELGEVEHNVQELVSHDEVSEAVAEVILPDATQTPTLAVFLTLPGAEDLHERAEVLATDLKRTLEKRLPVFMVPNAYIAIPRTPITATGKTDRKALRELGKSYKPPSILRSPESFPSSLLTDIEIDLRDVWATVLGINPNLIGPNHSFFEVGGDSIKTMSLVMAMRSKWDINVKASALFGPRSTLKDLAKSVGSSTKGQSLVDLAVLDIEEEVNSLIIALDSALPETCDICKELAPRISTVFLTGATGYLGSRLLRHLLERGVDRIILLIRPIKALKSLDCVINAAQVAGWWDASYASRIDIWEGDLAVPHLGLTPSQWDTLCGAQTRHGVIDAIIHNGAAVHWGTSYARLKDTNVNSTLQLLQASLQSTFLTRFVYISGGLSIDSDSSQKVTEADEATGYDQTKHVCEKLVAAAAARSPSQQRGRFSVVKPGLIVGDVENGVANADDFIWRVVMAAVKLGARPQEEMDSWLAIADVGSLSDMILRQTTACGCTIEDFVQVTRGMPLEAFWGAIESQLHVSLRSLPWERWIQAAKTDIAKEQERHPLWPVQQFLGRLGGEPPSQEGFDSEDITEMEAVIRRNVKYLEDIGLIGTVASDGWHSRGKVTTQRRVLTRPSRRDG